MFYAILCLIYFYMQNELGQHKTMKYNMTANKDLALKTPLHFSLRYSYQWSPCDASEQVEGHFYFTI